MCRLRSHLVHRHRSTRPHDPKTCPSSLLEVLDFAPLVQEFYRRSNIAQNLESYTQAYQAEGDRLRKPTREMVREILSYLHTRPMTFSLERVLIPPPAGKKDAPKRYTTRHQERHFYVVPDLLGVPGAINFRVIGDEYYAVLPEGTDPASSELRRAYLQYVIDPLLVRFNRDIAARREPIKQLLAEREKAGAAVSPDVFLAVSRSLVAAADTRFEETRRLELFPATLVLDSRQRKMMPPVRLLRKNFKRPPLLCRMKVLQGSPNSMSAVQCWRSFSRNS